MVRKKPPNERRSEERQRTRLRSGKIVGLDGRFIIECQFSDIAPHGARLRICDVPNLPERFWLFDDFYGRALLAQIVWRENREIGLQFQFNSEIAPLDEERLNQLAGKYYSL
ncbi:MULTISPECIES: PilZ domain-containing protein [Ochrobactrum]|uniref:PilZ domain-containing protein n=1 Tax=Ochrobactrum chromiisoli TaxID=2993941 RepID=A0ABT3QPH5_9HYPH|nr:PilZ domain-containing protein [Ochrobactrum chromiisoli]MCX2697519.1 PilZ domain-containing protein [Ochrobactrum chromiisoli]